jgi:hypothetical protein
LEKRANLLAASRATVQQKSSPEILGRRLRKKKNAPELTNRAVTRLAIQLFQQEIQLLSRETQLFQRRTNPLMKPDWLRTDSWRRE